MLHVFESSSTLYQHDRLMSSPLCIIIVTMIIIVIVVVVVVVNVVVVVAQTCCVWLASYLTCHGRQASGNLVFHAGHQTLQP